jgi:hypothetical protein
VAQQVGSIQSLMRGNTLVLTVSKVIWIVYANEVIDLSAYD